jgi:beta-lactamase class D
VHAAPAVKAQALPFLRIMFLFSIGLLVFFMLGGAFRAAGDARTPMVLGLGRPIVAIPAALVESLSDDELDQVALHELAHVRRRDDWAKLAQSAAEALCAFHPAARWIARRVDAEREVACDDWVISITRERRRYARCLLKLAGFGLASASVPAPGAVGRKPLISERIELVMKTNRNAQPKPSNLSRLSVVAALLVAAALCVASGPAVALTGRAVVDLPPAGGPRGAAPHSGPEPTAAAPRGAPEVSDTWLRAEAAAAIARDDARDETQFVRLQATKALGDRAGAVLVMKAKTGEVVAAVNQEWIFRRGFAPASTVKLVTALAGLEAGTLDPDERVAAQGARVDLDHALALSNNDYFRRVGQRVGYARFRAVAHELGLGEPTLADFGGEYAGVLPDDEPNDVLVTGEGLEVTPAQLATLAAALGNGGLLLAPRMPHGVDVAPMIRRRVDLDAENVRRLLPGMLGAVRYGTATGAAIGTIDVAGKTGTADGPELGTGLFVSFAPAEDPEYVVVVVLRGKGAMGAQAAAVAGQVYRAILGC